MEQVRDKNAQLSEQEIEAIKINQEIIKRMADNSQKIKNCFLLACSAFFVFWGSSGLSLGIKEYSAFAVITCALWFMDARYLRIERQFRKHHAAIIAGSLASLEDWEFNPSRYKVDCVFKIMFSFSEIIYPAMLVFLFILA